MAARPAHAQLRIVTYNTATADPEGGITTPRAGMDIVLQSIGEELRNGIAKPIDVLLLQEQYTMDITTEAFVVLLNGIYGAGTYAARRPGRADQRFARRCWPARHCLSTLKRSSYSKRSVSAP